MLLPPWRVLDLAGEAGAFCGKVLADLALALPGDFAAVVRAAKA